MICGGHAGRAHLKQLKALAEKKTFTNKFKDKFREKFPQVDAMRCGCKRHKVGCGCFSDMFFQRARINFSNILSSSETAKEFSERLQELVYHVEDVHQWSMHSRCAAVETVKTKMSANAKAETTSPERY